MSSPKRASKRLKLITHGALLALLVFVAVSLVFHLGGWRALEWLADDFKTQQLRSDKVADDQIVVLLVDESSLSAMDPVVGRWPWPRSVWADVLEYLSMGGAQSAVFDILFTERSANSSEALNPHDQALVEMNRQTDMAIHAMQLLRDPQNPFADRPLPAIFPKKFAFPSVEGVPKVHNNTYYIPFKQLYETAHRMGVVEFSPDADGTYRRTSLLRDYHDHYYPVLSLAPLIERLNFTHAKQVGQTLWLNDLAVPLDRSGHYQVNFYQQIKSVSIGSVLASVAALRRGEVEQLYQDPQLVPPDFFENKTVFIGTSAVGLEDMKDTPIQNRWPGVYLHASIASNILQKDFITQPPASWVYGMIFLAVLLTTPLVLGTASVIMQVVYPLGLVAIYSALNVFAQAKWGLQLDYVPVVAAIFFTWLTMSGYLSATEGREKRRVRQMLAQYVSPAALNTVLDNYEDQIKAEVGTEQEMSVVFSDIRGFTTISEGLTPAQVVQLLNVHLDAMTQVTFKYGGTMDKFIGDATMAFWGAPLPDPEHPLHATQAAMAMQASIPEVNQKLKSMGLKEIAIGVGVNTGKMILGNIGSSQKLDYTVIGDAVNLGSRLEGLTKQYHVPVLISEFTQAYVHEKIPCAPIDRVRVKGKHKPVTIYTPLCFPEDPKVEEWFKVVALAEQAFQAYHQQDFQRAKALFSQLPDQPFEQFKQLYFERCDAYLQTPPPKEWDGVYTLTTK
jgi:adenylate cyclase